MGHGGGWTSTACLIKGLEDHSSEGAFLALLRRILLVREPLLLQTVPRGAYWVGGSGNDHWPSFGRWTTPSCVRGGGARLQCGWWMPTPLETLFLVGAFEAWRGHEGPESCGAGCERPGRFSSGRVCGFVVALPVNCDGKVLARISNQRDMLRLLFQGKL
jgi:hypothetical protein